MGMKTIEAKRAELQKQIDLREKFVRTAQALKDPLAKVEKGLNEIEAVRARIAKDIASMDTFGVKEFEDYRQSLQMIALTTQEHLVQATRSVTRPLPTAPLDAVLKRGRDEIDKMMAQWVDKHVGSYPKEIKNGMTFKGPKGDILEILEVDKQTSHYKVKQDYKGKQNVYRWPVSYFSVQAGYKFLQA
jgi:hypothetical protein